MPQDNTPISVTCPKCKSEWPFEYNHCPIDGQHFYRIKQNILKKMPEFPVLGITDGTHLAKFIEDVERDMPKKLGMYAHHITLSDVAAAFEDEINKIGVQYLIRYYGFDGNGRRKQKEIAIERGVTHHSIVCQSIVRVRQSDTLRKVLWGKIRAENARKNNLSSCSTLKENLVGHN